MLQLDYLSFKEVVGKIPHDKRGPLYYMEDKEKFVLFFSDNVWKYTSVVLKKEIKEFIPSSEMDRDYIDFIGEFRKRNLENAIRIVGHDYSIGKPISEKKEEEDDEELIKKIPLDEELPFSTGDSQVIVDDLNQQILELRKKESGL